MTDNPSPVHVSLEVAPIEALVRTIDHLSDELDKHSDAIDTANLKATRVMWLAIVSIILCVLSFGFTIVGIINIRKANETIQEIKAVRLESREADCKQHNEFVDRVRNAMAEGLLTFVSDPDHLTEDEQRAYEGYVAALGEFLEYRDCSTQGIEDFYNLPVVETVKGQ